MCSAVPAIPPAHADALSLELGAGNLRSRGDALFLSWRRPAPALFGRESHYELALAWWSGPAANEALTLSRGMRLASGAACSRRAPGSDP